VAVTGGAGFIGSHTVDALVACGSSVLVIDDFTHACGHEPPAGVEVVTADCGGEQAAKALAAFVPDAVLHLAAKGGVARALRDPGDHVRVGLASTVSLFAAACAAGARRIVTASSGGTVYGDAPRLPADEETRPAPRSPYGAGKYAEEVYLGAFCLLHDIGGMALRYANVFGPRQDGTGEAGVVAISCWRLSDGHAPLLFGDGGQARDFVYVEDVAGANVAALASQRSGPVNVGTSIDTSVRSVLATLCRLAGRPVEFDEQPARPGEVRRTSLANARARRWLGWAPQTPLEEGLVRTKAYFETRPAQRRS
jgi:UDP-glucose 4-epimerase